MVRLLLHGSTTDLPPNSFRAIPSSQGEKTMKAMLITVVAATLAVGTAVRAQDLVQDTMKDVAHGTKKGAVKTADVTKDTSKNVAHGTTKAAKKTGHAVDTGAKDTGKTVKKGADKTADAVK